MLRYPRALGLLEGSWTQIGGEPALAMIVHGEAGTLLVHQPRAMREGQRVGAGRVEIATGAGSTAVDPPSLPDDQRDGPTYFLSCLRAGRPVEGLCTPDVGRDVQEVLGAALISSRTGSTVALPATSG